MQRWAPAATAVPQVQLCLKYKTCKGRRICLQPVTIKTTICLQPARINT